MMKKNEKGFSAVEGVLILVILALIGFVGWYVWHSKNNTDKSLNAAANTTIATTAKKQNTTISTTTSDTYEGWKTYTDKSSTYSFKYPANWTVNFINRLFYKY
jgi:predicted negative regulator of RcsB-dependent stress response